MENHRHRVVVTGTGMITPLGHSVAETWEAILAGALALAPSPCSRKASTPPAGFAR
jgi:3-oxoacyl-(acyl-carrier-protein) synthase